MKSNIHNTTFDIVEFIENNPLTRLNNKYQSALINKIRDDFNDEEQRMFVTSFYCYLKFDSTTDIVEKMQQNVY